MFSKPLLAPAILGLLVLPTVASAPLWVEEDKYTSTSDCNSANTQWTITTTCVKTVGTPATNTPKRLIAGVQYAADLVPVSAPTALLRDLAGNPIVVMDSGVPVELSLVPSAIDEADADATFGTLSSDHVWAAFRTNVEFTDPAGPFETWFKITYTFSAPVQATGASWVSSTLDDVAGNTVIDAYGEFPLPAGESFCFGDGGPQPGCTSCPCGNDAAPGTLGGCLNGVSQSARLLSSGTPSASSDTTRFQVAGANPSTFGILVSGGARLPNNPANPCFGLDSGINSISLDGLRCVGDGVIRHGSRATDPAGDIGFGNNGWGPPSGPVGGLLAQGNAVLPGSFAVGSTRHFQVFYREDALLVCQRGQNTTDAVSVKVLP